MGPSARGATGVGTRSICPVGYPYATAFKACAVGWSIRPWQYSPPLFSSLLAFSLLFLTIYYVALYHRTRFGAKRGVEDRGLGARSCKSPISPNRNLNFSANRSEWNSSTGAALLSSQESQKERFHGRGTMLRPESEAEATGQRTAQLVEQVVDMVLSRIKRLNVSYRRREGSGLLLEGRERREFVRNVAMQPLAGHGGNTSWSCWSIRWFRCLQLLHFVFSPVWKFFQ